MAVLTVANLRARVATAVEALASPSAWTESRWHADVFPTGEPGQWAHLSFAIAVTSTRFASPLESVRHKRTEGSGLVDTTITVRWLYRMRPDGHVADTALQLTAEQVLLVALTGLSLADLHLSIVECTRRAIGDGTYILGEVTLAAQHRISLT